MQEKKGIKEELEVAEVYDEGANIVLSGKVSFLPSKILTGKRKFVVDVTLNNKLNSQCVMRFKTMLLFF